MKSFLATLMLLAAWIRPAHALLESISLTDAAYNDTVTVRVGDVLEILVSVNTNGTAISGFQCFMHTNAAYAEPVPYAGNQLFTDNNLLPNGTVVFADDHDTRFPQDPLPGHQLDWCSQTGTGTPRPAYPVNGIACRFRLRFLQPVDGLLLGFDHDNNHFRNTLFWEGQSAIEHAFYRENPMVINVIGMEFGPLPDVYLTSGTPRDSLDLTDYLDQLLNIDPDSVWYSTSPLSTNNVCALDTLRLPGAYWLGFTGTGPGTQVDLEVTAHYGQIMAQDTLTVFRGDPPVIDDGMAAGDPFVTWPEDEETWLDLDDWVTDLDDPVENLRWSVLPGEYIIEMTIDGTGRRAHFQAGADWNGWDTLLVRVVDPGGMADTSRLVARVTPVNDPPELELPDLLEVHPGLPVVVDLEEITHDIDDSYADLYWEVLGDTTAVTARINAASRLLSLAVRPGTPMWTEAQIRLRVTDSGLLTDLDTLDVLVSTYPPVWQPIGELLVSAGSARQVALDDFVSDQDNPDAQLTLWVEGLTHVAATVDPLSHLATFTAPAGWAGAEWAQAYARDPDGNTDIDTLLVVALQGGDPLVALVPDLVFLPGQRDTLELDGHVWDLDTPDDRMIWTVQNNGIFLTQVDVANRRVVYTAPNLPGRTDLSTYRATDPENHWSEDVGSLAVIDPSGRPVVFPMAEIWMRVNSVDSSLVLDNVVYDYDHDPAELTWTVGAGSLVSGSVRASDRRLLLSSGFQAGEETLLLQAMDPTGLTGSGPLLVHVSEGNFPVVSAFAPRYAIAGQPDTLANLSNWVYDEDEGERISWSFVDPAGGNIHASWEEAYDRAIITTLPGYRGVDQIGAVATDPARNSDMEWIRLTTLENEPPVLAMAVLPNPAEPRLLDVVVVSDEPLRSLTATRAGDGATLSFSEMVVSQPTVRILRADLLAPDGVETWHVRAVDLPGYPQVAGNATEDSLVLGSAVLGRPGDGLVSPDGSMSLRWASPASAGRWVLREEGGPAGRLWTVAGPAGGRVVPVAVSGRLELRDGAGWRPLTEEEALSGVPGGQLRLASGPDGDGDGGALPGGFALEPAWPNPFNPETSLAFVLPRDLPVRLAIHDLAGRRVRTLLEGPLPAGRHAVRWDGLDDTGRPSASGLYFARLEGDGRQQVQKLLLVH